MCVHRTKHGCIPVTILEPELLINSVKMHISRVPDVEFDKEITILEAGMIERERILKGNADQMPFLTAGTDLVQNEEEFILTRDDERR